ncbi:hypothetical protein D3C83_75720 [compost metagenome]
MKFLSSLIQSPERNSCATSPVMACERMRCASCSAGGARNSPTTKAMPASATPMPASVAANRVVETPAVRITVYSEPATICASANNVPMRTAGGNSP